MNILDTWKAVLGCINCLTHRMVGSGQGPSMVGCFQWHKVNSWVAWQATSCKDQQIPNCQHFSNAEVGPGVHGLIGGWAVLQDPPHVEYRIFKPFDMDSIVGKHRNVDAEPLWTTLPASWLLKRSANSRRPTTASMNIPCSESAKEGGIKIPKQMPDPARLELHPPPPLWGSPLWHGVFEYGKSMKITGCIVLPFSWQQIMRLHWQKHSNCRPPPSQHSKWNLSGSSMELRMVPSAETAIVMGPIVSGVESAPIRTDIQYAS